MEEIEQLIGRRRARRASVTLPGELLSASRCQKVMITDISNTGARVSLMKQVPLAPVILSWDNKRVAGEVMWLADGQAGIKFDKEL